MNFQHQQECVDELECVLEEKYGDMEEEDFSKNCLIKNVMAKPWMISHPDFLTQFLKAIG